MIMKELSITCSAVAHSRVLRTALVPYGNMETSTPHSSETSQVITMKFCSFDYVRETNTCAMFGWYPAARDCSIHTWNIHFLWFLLALVPFFLRTCTGQTDRDNFTHNGSKDAVWRKEVNLPASVFLSFDVLAVILPQNPQNSAPVGNSQSNTKSRITCKPCKIDTKCQLNMNIKWVLPFQNPSCKIAWGAPWQRNHDDVISGLQ